MKIYYIDDSNIDGKGVFINKNIEEGVKIGKVIDYRLYFYPCVTNFLGKWINHSNKPNSKIYYDNEKNVYNLYSIKKVNKDEEILMDYNDTPWYIEKAHSDYK